jgi:hypothetical protein
MPSSNVVEPRSRSLKCLDNSVTAEAIADSLLETRVISFFFFFFFFFFFLIVGKGGGTMTLMSLLNVDSRVRGGKSNGSRYESNGLELTVVYCEQV